METNNQYNINFKKYRNYCKLHNIPIPAWMNHIIFKEVIDRMSKGNKLQACKYLCDLSTENKTRTRINDLLTGYAGYEFGLKWSKQEVVDVIDLFKVFVPLSEPVVVEPPVQISPALANEVREAIYPFAQIAKKIFAPNVLVRNETTVTVRSADLHMIMRLAKKLESL